MLFLSYIQDKFSIFAKISFQYKETDIITIFFINFCFRNLCFGNKCVEIGDVVDDNIILNALVINEFVLSLHSKPLFLKRRFRK